MLVLSRLSDPHAHYYFSDPAREIDEEPPGYWLGTQAQRAGRFGRADRQSVERVLSGRHLMSDAQLAPRGSRPGYDLVFTAPKSVSVLFALGDDTARSAVLSAHKNSVAAALSHLEDHVATLSRPTGRAVGTNGVVGIGFDHGKNRGGEPHLHTHLLLANLVQGEDGRYGRLDGRGLFAHRASLGALYDAQLRAELGERLCVTFVRARSGALEVAQVDPFLRGLYSGRSAELAQHRFERTRRSMRFIDREEKSFERDAVAWRRHWRNSAERMGVTVAALSQVSQRPLLNRGERENSQGATLDERHFAWRIGAHSATLCRRHVVGGAAHATLDGAPIASLNAFVDAIATFGEGRGLSEGRVPLVAVTAKAHISELLGPRPLTVEALHRWQEVAASLTRSERDLSHGERDFGQRARSRALSTWQRESFR